MTQHVHGFLSGAHHVSLAINYAIVGFQGPDSVKDAPSVQFAPYERNKNYPTLLALGLWNPVYKNHESYT